MKPIWKDVTRYLGDDKERKPTGFQIGVGDLQIIITCAHIYHSPDWVMHCFALQIDTKRLQATTAEEAQAEAIAAVKERLAKLTANFYQIRGNAVNKECTHRFDSSIGGRVKCCDCGEWKGNAS